MKMILRIILLSFLCSPFTGFAQNKDEPKVNWQNLDWSADGVLGISTEKSYPLLQKRQAQTVVVAVIDGGTDIEHEDLKRVIWTNVKEIPGNAKDDDGNGYVDDIHGWNFIGSVKGNVQFDNMELVRLIRKLEPKYGSALNSTPFSPNERKEFELYQQLITDYVAQLEEAKSALNSISFIRKTLKDILANMGKNSPTLNDFEDYKPADEMEAQVIKIVKSELKDKPEFDKIHEELEEAFKYYNTKVNYHLNMDFDPRSMVGDRYEDSKDKYYGNNDVIGPDAEHGTHVAGIIGAVRDNGLGIKGVADHVQIMPIRVVPDGDERDKDVANAIRYATDNGAKVINMSFGKSYAWDKSVVDDAVRYAQSRDVLLVHAAGNDGKDTDIAKNYPTRFYTDSTGLNTGMAINWIEVGASGWEKDESLAASFSNYGKKNVDVFAPGVKINSTIPQSKYKDNDGTSMAAPVVSGLAALLRAYFPKLSAKEVKDIILKSVVKVDQKVKVKKDASNARLDFKDICLSGGIINAYQAVELALKQSR
ncbi:MAG: S8 family peptidase [Sphingobacteriaceae bacterium]